MNAPGIPHQVLAVFLDHTAEAVRQVKSVDELTQLLVSATEAVKNQQFNEVKGMETLKIFNRKQPTSHSNDEERPWVSLPVPAHLAHTIALLIEKLACLESADPKTHLSTQTALHWLATSSTLEE